MRLALLWKVADAPDPSVDGGRCAWPFYGRWPMRLALLSTVVDLPRIPQDGGRSDDISSACRVGGSTTVLQMTVTMADAPTFERSRRECAEAGQDKWCQVGDSAPVNRQLRTTDPPG